MSVVVSCAVLLLVSFSQVSVTAADPLVALQIQDNAGSISIGESYDVNITRTSAGDLAINTNVWVAGTVQSAVGYQFRHRVIAAKYQSVTTTNIPHNSAYGMDLGSKVLDSQPTNTCNGFSTCTIPVSGYYSFSAYGCFGVSSGTGDRSIWLLKTAIRHLLLLRRTERGLCVCAQAIWYNSQRAIHFSSCFSKTPALLLVRYWAVRRVVLLLR